MEKSPSKTSIFRRDNNSLPAPPQVDLIPQAQSIPTIEPPKDELDLRQLIAMLRRRSPVIAGVAIVILSFAVGYTLLQKPVYGGRFRMLVEPVDNSNRNLSGLTSSSSSTPSQSELDYPTQVQVLLDPKLIIATIERLKESYPNLNYISLVQSLTIERLKETKILEVGYQSENAAEVTAVLNQLADDYIDYSIEQRQTNLRQGIKFVNDQLPSTQSRVDQLQLELQVFRQQNNFVDPSTQTSQIANQATQLNQQDLAIGQSLAQAQASFASLQGETGSVAALNSAPLYQQLMGQLRQVEVEIATERTRFQDDNLAIQVLQEKQENLLPLLSEEAERVVGGRLAEVATQIQTLSVQRQALAQVQAQLNRKSEELPVLIRRYTDLQRELEVATDSLNRFLITRETLEIEVSQKEIPWQIVEAPFRYPNQVSPSLRRNVILGILASVSLGFGLALLIEKLDDVYYDLEELKAKTKLPLLGVIPLQKQFEDIESNLIQERKPLDSLERLVESTSLSEPTSAEVLEQTPLFQPVTQRFSKFLASLQVLCTKIQLLGADRPVRSMVVTSALAGDGKSTIAMHLAQTSAEMGQRVLLVDADLRQSQLQSRLNLNSPRGLSHLLAQHLPLNEVIYQPLQEPGFFLLPAGEAPPDPVKLLASHKMQQFMEEATQFFDLVIYDVPALDGLADASLLAPHTDGIVLVVRLGKTERFALSQTLENLRMSQMPVLGFIANGATG
jgi:polysaccharide biosynthesis transport protein